MVDRRGRARSFRRVASLGGEIEADGSAAVKIIFAPVRLAPILAGARFSAPPSKRPDASPE